MHSDSTLCILDTLTTEYGQLMRQLARDTADVDMRETPREQTVRRRRELATNQNKLSGKSQPKAKPVTLLSIKLHMMAHYMAAIRFWGTVDSFTTGIVCSISLEVASLFYQLTRLLFCTFLYYFVG